MEEETVHKGRTVVTWRPATTEVSLKFPALHALFFDPHSYLPVYHAAQIEGTHSLLELDGKIRKLHTPPLIPDLHVTFIAASDITFTKAYYDMEMFQFDLRSNASISNLGKTSMTLSSEFRNSSTDELLSTYSGVWVITNALNKRPISFYSQIKVHVASPRTFPRLTVLEPPTEAFESAFEVRHSDTDQQHHMNQASYTKLGSDAINFACNAGSLRNLRRFEINKPERIRSVFVEECTMGAVLKVSVWQDLDNPRIISVNIKKQGQTIHYLEWIFFKETPRDKEHVASVDVTVHRGRFHELEYSWDPAKGELVCREPALHAALFLQFQFLRVNHACKVSAAAQELFGAMLLGDKTLMSFPIHKTASEGPLAFMTVGTDVSFTPAYYKLREFECDLVSTVKTAHVGKTSMSKLCEVRHSESGDVLVMLASTLVSVNAKARKPVPAFKRPNKHVSTRPPARLQILEPPSYAFQCEFIVRHSDIDYQNHTNQSCYVKFSSDAFNNAHFSGRISGAEYEEINKPERLRNVYLGESHLGDVLVVWVWQDVKNPRLLHAAMKKNGRTVHYLEWTLFGIASAAFSKL